MPENSTNEDLQACQRLMQALKEIKPAPNTVADPSDWQDMLRSGADAMRALDDHIAECDRRVDVARHSAEIERLAAEARELHREE